jgi:trans-2,3-dihydro-3-hydroxyanthranilate isomerase
MELCMPAPASLAYHTTDVFTNRAFGGNPLAVVIDDLGLAPDVMQRIAAEFNYSETIFLAPPAQPENTARARIFTPRSELPFAGHPNIGGAFIAARLGSLFGRQTGGTIRFEEAAGLVEIEILQDRDEISGARLTAPQPLAIGPAVEPAIIAAWAGLAVADIRPDSAIASVGLPFIFAELAEDRALAGAAPDPAAFTRHEPSRDSAGLALYHRQADHLHLRMFAPLDGISEDPATGSAGAALAGLLASRDPRPEGLFAFTIAQGAEMGRPSHLRADARKEAGAVTRIRIGGSCVAMMSGQLSL